MVARLASFRLPANPAKSLTPRPPNVRNGPNLEVTPNPTVCVEFENGVQLVPHATNPCKWTFSFQSVIGYGRVQELTADAERIAGLTQIMRH